MKEAIVEVNLLLLVNAIDQFREAEGRAWSEYYSQPPSQGGSERKSFGDILAEMLPHLAPEVREALREKYSDLL